MLKLSLVVASSLLSASFAVADPDKDESGKGRWGYYAEEYRDDYRGRYRDRGYYGDRRDRDRQKSRERGRVPPGHYPPPGECRMWNPDLPPGHQPPPYRC